MPAPKPHSPGTRFLIIDCVVFLVVYRAEGVLFARRLEDLERTPESFADRHPVIEARLRGRGSQSR